MTKRTQPHGQTAWRNRITGYGSVDPEELLANPLNYRIHPKAQQDALAGTLNSIGWIQDVIVNAATGFVLDGHLRVALALRTNQPEIPVKYVELTPEEEALALATLDPLTNMAGTDAAKLDELLQQVQTDEAAIQAMLAGLAEEAGLYLPKGEPSDAEPQIDRAEELRQQWGVELGQLWRLPSRTEGQEHRLICGDCTEAAVVGRVMGGLAEMVWTDPPYGVAVGDKNKFLNSIGPANRIEENLENDTLDESGLVAMLEAAFDNAIKHCRAGAAWYVAAPPGPLHVLFGQILKQRGVWRQTIQWVKNNATFAPLGIDYHWRAEPIFFGWLPNAAHRFYGGRKQDTVWEIDRPQKSPEHPTMKPVELVARAIENHSQTGEIVLDLFLGSGTTIIACENLSRQCRAVELSPGYVAVALERYFQAFGIEAELVG